jgi:elongator complex protein 3
VTKGSLLHKWWLAGKYKAYSDEDLYELIVDCKKIIPHYARIIRLIRDIPGESILAGNMVTNLRQIMQQRGVQCNCIRCREPKDGKIKNYELRVSDYEVGKGQEYFIEYCSEDKKTLYAFCRLYLAKNKNNILGDAALIRELHVYGELVPMGGDKKVQHTGLGTKLIEEAERITRENDYDELVVISGVGVRGYYRKFGYRLSGNYMKKSLRRA